MYDTEISPFPESRTGLPAISDVAVSTQQLGQALTIGAVRYVLGISLRLAIAAIMVVYILFRR
jgi:hypothetical protein